MHKTQYRTQLECQKVLAYLKYLKAQELLSQSEMAKCELNEAHVLVAFFSL